MLSSQFTAEIHLVAYLVGRSTQFQHLQLPSFTRISTTRPLRPLSILNGDDVGLNGIICCVCRVASRHDPFEEGTDCFIAVVTTGPQNDGSFLVHGRIATTVGLRSAIPGRQSAR